MMPYLYACEENARSGARSCADLYDFRTPATPPCDQPTAFTGAISDL